MSKSADTMLTWVQRYPRLAVLIDPAINDEAFDCVVESFLDEAIRFLEDNANLYGSLSEEQLTGIIDAVMRRDGIRVGREMNVNGHVDLCIEFDLSLSPKRRLGEAKCWGGSKRHADGIAQLIGYMTGREGSGYVIDYIKQDGIATKWSDLRTYLDTHRPAHQEADSQPGASAWSLQTRHTHPSAMSVRIVHYGVNLFRPT